MIILAPIGWLYGLTMQLRNALYDRGIFKSYDLGARTISVGNLTTGGTGKTPLVALIAEILAEHGEKVCILTRGYGRQNERERVLVSDGEKVLVDAETGGDEPVELAYKLVGKAIIVADADRVAAAKWAKENFEVTAFIVDDGFQHRRAQRDLDIVCIDATDPFGNGKILPAGNLRESVNNLKRANAVIVTRADQEEDVSMLEERIRKTSSARIFTASSPIAEIVPLEEFHAKTQRTQSDPIKDAFVFCGIGNANSFLRSLADYGVELVGKLSLKDHSVYDRVTIEKIETEARSANAKALITTAKDAVKLNDVKFSLPCNVAMAETVVEEQSKFRELITSS